MNTSRETIRRSLTLKSRHSDVEKLHDFLRAVTRELLGDQVDRDLVHSIILSVHEVFTNIVRHAYPEGKGGEVLLYCTPTSRGVVIEIVDHGVEFNPLINTKNPDTSILDELENVNDLIELEESRITGGYGIPIIHAATTSTEYHRSLSGDNHLYLYFEYHQ